MNGFITCYHIWIFSHRVCLTNSWLLYWLPHRKLMKACLASSDFKFAPWLGNCLLCFAIKTFSKVEKVWTAIYVNRLIDILVNEWRVIDIRRHKKIGQKEEFCSDFNTPANLIFYDRTDVLSADMVEKYVCFTRPMFHCIPIRVVYQSSGLHTKRWCLTLIPPRVTWE